MKKTIFSVIIVILLILGLNGVFGQEMPVERENGVVLYYFYGKGCSHCARMGGFLDDLEENYPSITIERFETYFNKENRELFERVSSAYGERIHGVPTLFVDDKVFVGFSGSVGEEIEEEVERCLGEECISPEDKLNGDGGDGFQKIAIPVVISAAAVDAINPCAFAVLIILLTTVIVTGSRRKALFAGLAFSIAIYISYFLMGVGLYSAIQVSGLTHIIYTIVAILAIIIGLFNLKDYLWYGKWFKMEVPESWRPKMKALVKSVISVPGAFIMGFIVSLFLLPCTSGPYIVILGLLAKTVTRNYALGLLLLYNFIFILPMLIITLGIYFGFTTTQKAEEWRRSKLRVLHLIAGIVILLLGVGMLIALEVGII